MMEMVTIYVLGVGGRWIAEMKDELSEKCPVEGRWWTLRACGKAPNGLADCRKWCLGKGGC